MSDDHLPPASSMFRHPSLTHESNGGSDYCHHCGIDMCSQGGVNGQCPSLKRQYDTLVKEGKITPFPGLATSPAPTTLAEWVKSDDETRGAFAQRAIVKKT